MKFILLEFILNMEYLPKNIAIEIFGEQAFDHHNNDDHLIELYKKFSSPAEGILTKNELAFKNRVSQKFDAFQKVNHFNPEKTLKENIPHNSLTLINNNNEVLSCSKQLHDVI